MLITDAYDIYSYAAFMVFLTSAANINTSPQALSDNQSDAGLGNFLGTVVPPDIRNTTLPKIIKIIHTVVDI